MNLAGGRLSFMARFPAARRGRLREWTPFAILLAAMLAWLAMGLDRDYFYRPLGHSSQSAETLAMADNLSPSLAFLIFRRAYLRADGETGYEVYHRFPLAGYALVRLATLPFDGDLAAKILAARTLTLLMFGAAAALFYLALARTLASRWAALGGVALAFSGHYTLYYSDMIDTERTMGLFGIALAFHGMAVFVREGRFRQLALKAGAAALLDWQVLALILPFAAFGAALAAVRAARTERGGAGGGLASKAAAAVFGAMRSRHAAVGAITLAVAFAALGFNLANEYAALGGRTPPSEIPTVKSMTERLAGEGYFSWAGFARTEFLRTGAAHMSLALPGYGDRLARPGDPLSDWAVAAGVAAVVACAAALFLARKRAPILIPLALSVFIWDLTIRQYAASHNYQGMFHFAPALALFSLALLYVGERFGRRIGAAAALAAVGAFMLCAFQMNALSHGDEATEKALLADYEAMRETARGKTVYFDQSIRANRSAGFPHDDAFYLSGAALLSYNHDDLIPADMMQPVIEAADLVLSRGRIAGAETLTPDNREAFLYDPRDISALRLSEYEEAVSSGEPAARGAFDLRVADGGGALIYAKRPCAPSDTRARFFLHAHAADFDDLPPERRLLKFEGFDFLFGRHGAIFGGACMARAELPEYAVSRIDTGQFASDEGRLWSAELRFPIDDYLRETYEAAARLTPAVRSVFDVYLADGALIYAKSPCEAEDARGRFLLSAYPSDDGDLEVGREELGHNSLNFSFDEYGGIVDGVCAARRPLPDYGLERLEVGQWIPGGDTLWGAEILVGD